MTIYRLLLNFHATFFWNFREKFQNGGKEPVIIFVRPSESRACNSFSQSEHKSMHYWPLGWARWPPGWFMSLPTFQALDMSVFHSDQGRGYDCNKLKNKLWDVFCRQRHFFDSFSKFLKVKVCGGSVWEFYLKVDTFLRTFPDTPPESPKKWDSKRSNFAKH